MSPKFLSSSFCVFVSFITVVSSNANNYGEEQNFSNNITKKIMGPKVERLEEIETTELGEGPHWDNETQSLYFVDIFGKAIHKYVPATKKHTKAIIGTNHVSLIIPVKNEKNKFLISIGRDLAVVTWDGESESISKTEKLYEVDDSPDTIDNRFNDGKCDSTGRLWAGTMGGEPVNGEVKRNKGAFYSFSDKKVVKHISGVGISNGLAWNDDLKKFYYIDTHKGAIREYDFNIKDGTISNEKIIFTLDKHGIKGGLDGMTIDTNGNLWVAVFAAYRVIQIDPRKPETLLQSIDIPASQVTSVAFGGPNLDELYVTTAKFTIGNDVLPPPLHGGTYRITGINAKGYPGVSVVL